MRKILCGVLAFIICSLSIISYAEQTNLKQEQEDLKTKIEQSTGDLENVQNELSENMQQIQQLDEQIQSSQQEVDSLQFKIDEFESAIGEVQEVLDVAEEKYAMQKDSLEKRLVAMYEAGNTEYLDVILTSKNMSDFLSNYYLAAEMAENDTALLEDISVKKGEIQSIKEQLKDKQKELTEAKQEQQKKAKIIENAKVIRENYSAQLSGQEREIQAKIDEYNKRFEEINTQILQLAKQGIDTQYIGGELAWPVPGYTRITSKYRNAYTPNYWSLQIAYRM